MMPQQPQRPLDGIWPLTVEFTATLGLLAMFYLGFIVGRY